MEQLIPEVGWWSVSDDIYHRQWDACNASRLKDFSVSAELCLYNINHPKTPTEDETESKVLGSAVHCAVLEPDYYEDRYVREPSLEDLPGTPKTRGANVYKEARMLASAGVLEPHLYVIDPALKMKAEKKAEHYDIVLDAHQRGKRKVLTEKQYDISRRIRDRLLREPSQARDLVESFDQTEVSVVADDPVTGVRCKVRPDGVLKSTGLIADLKTTRNIDKRGFARDIYTYGYFRSAPYYVDVCNWFGVDDEGAAIEWKHHVFLSVETHPPYQTVVYNLDPSDVDLGRRSYRSLLDRYAQCEKSNEWPGMPTRTISISMPQWAVSQEEEKV